MSGTWLSPEEIEELTALKRWSAQCRALARMGIPFLPNAVGRPLVERGAVCSKPAPERTKKREPNWDAMPKPRERSK
ncbi:DUF4224 domain-containing protein [Lysobacter tyrosinilyticus]